MYDHLLFEKKINGVFNGNCSFFTLYCSHFTSNFSVFNMIFNISAYHWSNFISILSVFTGNCSFLTFHCSSFTSILSVFTMNCCFFAPNCSTFTCMLSAFTFTGPLPPYLVFSLGISRFLLFSSGIMVAHLSIFTRNCRSL